LDWAIYAGGRSAQSYIQEIVLRVWLAFIMSSVLPLDAKAIPRLGFFVLCLEDELGFGGGEEIEEEDTLLVLDNTSDVGDDEDEDRGTDVDVKLKVCPQTETKKHESCIQKGVMDDEDRGRGRGRAKGMGRKVNLSS